jgi:hypothetical protein
MFNDIQFYFLILFSFKEKYLKIICFLFFSILVPVKDGKEENTNTFLSSSLQQSPSTDDSPQEEIPVIEKLKENINQTISTIIPDEEHQEIEESEQSTPNLSEENKEEEKEIQPCTPSSGLNPEATPFFALPTTKTENAQSISTGDESDDENESSKTSVTSGKR